MKDRFKILLDKSLAAMRAAVDIVNRPKYDYREEVFVILCVNSWELLIKAKWLKDHQGKISCLFVKDSQKNKKAVSRRYKKTRSGNPMTHELSRIIGMMNSGSDSIDSNVVHNIELLMESRDNAIHFFNKTAQIDKQIREVGLASIKNYVEIVEEWFEVKIEDFGFCLVPISVVNPPASINALCGNREEKKFVNYLSSIISQQDNESPKSVSVYLDIQLQKRANGDGIKFQLVKDSENKISISEDDILIRFPWEYNEVREKMRKRYSNIVYNNVFHDHMKKVSEDTQFCYVRYQNPITKKMPKKFYSTNIFQYFDKIYTKVNSQQSH